MSSQPVTPPRYHWKPDAPQPPVTAIRRAPEELTDDEVVRITLAAIRAAGEKGISRDELNQIVREMEGAIIGYALVCGLLQDRFTVRVSGDGEVVWSAAADEETTR